MRRARRIIVALLATALALAWLVGGTDGYAVAWFGPGGWPVLLVAGRAGVGGLVSTLPVAPRRAGRFLASAVDLNGFEQGLATLLDNASFVRQSHGCTFTGALRTAGSRWLAVGVPGWAALLPAGVVMVAATIRFVQWTRRYRRRRTGMCPSCGYDLRATPGRCPECGLLA